MAYLGLYPQKFLDYDGSLGFAGVIHQRSQTFRYNIYVFTLCTLRPNAAHNDIFNDNIFDATG